MGVRIVFRDREFEVSAGIPVKVALKQIDILPETILFTREGELITEDEMLRDGDEVNLIAVISGG
jgi:sulfur carrier protein ThiS